MASMPDLTAWLERLSPGDHVCQIYSSEADYASALSAGVRTGLARQQRVVCLTAAFAPHIVFDILQTAQVDARSALVHNQLELLNADEVYGSPDGAFDPRRPLARLDALAQQARQQGYTGLYLITEMTWVRRYSPNNERHLEYSRLLSTFLEQTASVGLCQYDRGRLPAAVLLDALATHPTVIIDTHPCANVYYRPPHRPPPDRDELLLQQHLSDLLNRRELEYHAAQLRVSEDRYRRLYDHIADALFVHEIQPNGLPGRFVEANDVACQRLGYTRAELLALSPQDIDAPEAGVDVAAVMVELQTKGSATFEQIHVARDGRRIPVEIRAQRIELDDRPAIITLARDISRSTAAEAALRASEETTRIVVNAAPLAIIISQQGIIRFANPAATALLGCNSTSQLLNHAVTDFVAPANLALATARLQRLNEQQANPPIEMELRRVDGSLVQAESVSVPIMLYGEAAAVIIGQDITQRKHVENILQASLRLSEYANTHTLDEVLQQTLDEAEALTGSVIGFFHFVAADQQTLLLQTWSTHTLTQMCTAQGKGQHYPIGQAGVWVDCVATRRPIIHNDYASLPNRKGLPLGHAPVMRELIVPVLRGDLIVAILGVGNKPTEYHDRDIEVVERLANLAWDSVLRKRSEEALRRSEALLNTSQQLAHVGGWEWRVGPQTMYWTDETYRIHGLPPNPIGYATGAIIEQSIACYDPARQPLIRAAFQRCLSTGEPYDLEFAFTKITGEKIWIRTTGQAVWDNGQIVAARGNIVDISDLKQALQAEQEQSALAEALRQAAMALNATLNLEDVLDAIMQSVESVVPLESVSVMLLDGDEAYTTRFRDHLHRTDSSLRGLRLRVSTTPNLRHMRETAEPLLIVDTHTYPGWLTAPGRDWIRSYAGAPIRVRGELVGFLNLYSEQPNGYQPEHVARLNIFAQQAAIAITNARLHAHISHYAEDLEIRVAERTRELREANTRLTDLDRLKDEFISRLSHELRTPLTSIKIYLELLKKGKPEKREKYFTTLFEQADRLQNLIEQLLNISRLNEDAPDVTLALTDLNALVNTVLDGFTPSLMRRQQTAHVLCHPALPPIVTDANILTQALDNVLENAVAYTPPGGHMSVVTSYQLCNGQPGVTVTIQDSGPGISDRDLPYIFDRFYRGEAARDYRIPGVGLGLPIAQALITQLGGQITVHSEPGHGTEVIVWLPGPPQDNPPSRPGK